MVEFIGFFGELPFVMYQPSLVTSKSSNGSELLMLDFHIPYGKNIALGLLLIGLFKLYQTLTQMQRPLRCVIIILSLLFLS